MRVYVGKAGIATDARAATLHGRANGIEVCERGYLPVVPRLECSEPVLRQHLLTRRPPGPLLVQRARLQ